ncbi:MAG: ParB N-terminal domain-containing protein [Caulobacter sp.]|nr:ParB N-terminal domain-containing protein [Caulobacter sp.]
MAEPALTDAATVSAPEVVDYIVLVPVDLIEVKDRLRPVDPVSAQALAAVMLVDGHQDPIEVCRLPGRSDYRLVAGAHRLEAHRLNGWSHIKALIVDADAMSRRMRQVSENLWRTGLDPLARSAFVAELHELLRAKAGIKPGADGRSISINARWQKALKDEAADTNDTMSLVYGFTAEIGETLGLTKRSIERDLLLQRRLSPSVAAQLRSHPVGRNAAQLRALTKLSEADQRRAADMILQGRVKNAGEAVALLVGKVPASADAKRLSAFLGAFERMGAAERRAALRTLADLKLPKGVRLTFDGVADA